MIRRRAPKGFTLDICPGCGELPPHGRRSNGVCPACTAIIDNAKKRQAERDAAGNDAPRLYAVPELSHWLPYLREPRKVGDEAHPIQKAFHDLIRAVSEHEDVKAVYYEGEKAPKHIVDTPRRGYDNTSFGTRRLFKPSVAEAIRVLFSAVYHGLDACYEDGKDDGTRLLMLLNAGEISPAEFERRKKQ